MANATLRYQQDLEVQILIIKLLWCGHLAR